jgi:hypothetical protein
MTENVKTVRTFLENVEKLSRLPLITNREMNFLFGDKVALVLGVLDNYNRQKQLCSNCEKRCCLIARCEIYAPQFAQCPIHELRPLVCRLHFCHYFQTDHNSEVREMSDVFFNCLLAADRDGNPRVRFFDSPPLAIAAPGLVEIIAPWAKSVREDKMNPLEALRLIYHEAGKYRMTPLVNR